MVDAWRERDDSRPKLARPREAARAGDGPWREWDDSRPKLATPPLDAAIAAIARAQYGVITMRQLADLGVSRRAVSHRAAAGRLHRVHRGVYAVGHTRLTGHGRWMAAVLACGDAAALFGASAAALRGIRRGNAARPPRGPPPRPPRPHPRRRPAGRRPRDATRDPDPPDPDAPPRRVDRRRR